MGASVKVRGKIFYWTQVLATDMYPELLHPAFGVVRADVLKIWDEMAGFEVAIRVEALSPVKKYLGPVLVLGDSYPDKEAPIEARSLIRLRPRISWVDTGEITSKTVERFVQWSISAHFRAVYVTALGTIIVK